MRKKIGFQELLKGYKKNVHSASFAKKYSNVNLHLFICIACFGIALFPIFAQLQDKTLSLILHITGILMGGIWLPIVYFRSIRVQNQIKKIAQERNIKIIKDEWSWHWGDNYNRYLRKENFDKFLLNKNPEYIKWLRNEISLEMKRREDNSYLSIIFKNSANGLLFIIIPALLIHIIKENGKEWKITLAITAIVYLGYFLINLFHSASLKSWNKELIAMEDDLREVQHEIFFEIEDDVLNDLEIKVG